MTSSEAARRALSLAVLTVACSLVAACAGGGRASRKTAERPPERTTGEAAPAETVPVEPLVRALRRGGYVVYLRHAATDPSPDDADPVVLSDCDTQRNHSAAGRTQARSLGRAIASLEIPIGHVLSSPFCRALETARLVFGKATRESLLENLETAEGEAEASAHAPAAATVSRLVPTAISSNRPP